MKDNNFHVVLLKTLIYFSLTKRFTGPFVLAPIVFIVDAHNEIQEIQHLIGVLIPQEQLELPELAMFGELSRQDYLTIFVVKLVLNSISADPSEIIANALLDGLQDRGDVGKRLQDFIQLRFIFFFLLLRRLNHIESFLRLRRDSNPSKSVAIVVVIFVFLVIFGAWMRIFK